MVLVLSCLFRLAFHSSGVGGWVQGGGACTVRIWVLERRPRLFFMSHCFPLCTWHVALVSLPCSNSQIFSSFKFHYNNQYHSVEVILHDQSFLSLLTNSDWHCNMFILYTVLLIYFLSLSFPCVCRVLRSAPVWTIWLSACPSEHPQR